MSGPAPPFLWQIDFKDISSVQASQEGKQMHVVEACNVVDVGTSILLDAHVRADFTAETALMCIVESFQKHGLPHKLLWIEIPVGSATHEAATFPRP